jgi:hypothetical protein
LVYRFDPRHAAKQRIAEELLSRELADDSLVIPHQAIVEFMAAVIRPRRDLEAGVRELPPLYHDRARGHRPARRSR